MDSPPPPYTTTTRSSNPSSKTKSASRLARTTAQEPPPPTLSLDLVSYSPSKPQNPPSLHDLLLLSPSPSPAKRSKTRLDAEEVSDHHASRRRCKNRFPNVGSPRTTRRSRRRVLEQEIREDKDKDKDLICGGDDLVVVATNKIKKRRHSGRSKKEKSVSIPSPKGNDNDDYGYDFDQIGLMVNDLVMWNDVAKSSLWFGFGSLCFLSSCFTTGISFSMLSLMSQVGLVCLGVSFFSNMIAQRNGIESKREFKLKEANVLRAARVVLPAANFAISKGRDLFSGEPSMTLKVAPLLLLGSEYGHIVTFKRLFALGFFIGFTGPKLYSLYSTQIRKKGENVKLRTVEAWEGCSHKKIVAASAVTAFWNLTSIKTRIFAAFICLVMFRWYRQSLSCSKVEGQEKEEESQQHQEKALTLVE